MTYSLDDDAGGRFAIDGTTGVITVADSSLLDFETTTSHTVTVKATSDDGSTSTQTFTINLTDDTSEASVSAISDNDGSANSVNESAANGTAVGVTALATDADATDDVTYSLDDDAGGRFAIDGTTGVITVADNSLLDFETTTSHTVTVKATSDDGSTSTQTFTINLTDDTSESSVSAISDNDGSANSVSESAANGTAVGVTALATDADATDDVSYSLDDDAGGRFAIDGTTGVITVADNSLLDFETTTSHTVTVKATSDDGSTSTQTFTINLTDDTSEASVSAISDNDGSANSVSESAANGTAVGVTALATDADATDDVSYSLDDDAGGRFAIDGTTGVITVADNSLLDFETTTSHTVTVKATSDDGSTSTQTFTINLTDDTSEASVSAISDNDGSANSVNESAANGTAVGVTALATDADATDDVTYSLDDDAGGRFAIDGTTGVITVADNSLLDFETTTSHTVTVKATSDDGSTSTQTFTINLTDDTSEASVSAISDNDGSANSVSESAANGTAVGVTALATDADATDDVSYSLDDDAGGRFAIDGTTGVITVADNSLLDFETTTSHTVTVKATSDDGSTSTQTFTINLTDDTSESSVSAISDNDGSANSVSESAANGTAVGVTALATDADATDDVTYSLDDDAGGRFAIDGTTGVITVADNSLLDFETTTSHTVTVKATSDDGSTSTQTFTINLTDDTSEASVSAISDNDGSANSVNESAANGTAVGVTALATDADATDDVTYSLDDDAGGRFAIDGTTGVITVADNSLLDFETTTSHTVTVKATSDDGSTSTQTFTINLTDDTSESSVSAISDNDGSANSVSESAANGTAVGVTALATDADATDDVSYSLDDDAGGRFAIDGTTGVITVADNSLLDFETTTSHTVTVKATSDDGSTSTQTFTINLTDDTAESGVSAISDSDGSANSVSESAANGTAVGVTALATDPDITDDVTYSLDDDAGGRFAIDGTTGVITVADNSLLDFETTTSHTVTVKATSDDGSTSTQTFTINLTDDTSESSVSAISDNDGSANSVSESAANGTAVGVTALATDADATDDVSYSLDDDAGGRFAIDGTTGVITVADNSLLDFETTTSHTVTVKATSDDGSTSTQTFTINLTDDTSEASVSAISDNDGSANSVSESAANGTAVGVTALATDADATDDVSYSLDDDAGGRFAIDGTTGVITVADNSLLDFETTTSHTVTVKATSDDGSTSTQTFTINLTDDTSEASVSAISDNDGSANSVSESAANGTAVGVTALATDADATDDVTYSLDDDAGGRFAIDGTTGVITVADNSLLDFETTTSHTVTVKATSDDGSTSTQTFTINLTDDTSEASVSAISDNDGSANSVSESAANGTAVGVTALATDADATDDVTYSLDDDAGGRFAIDGTTGVITVADNSLLDFETTTSHTVTVKATSDDGSTSTQTFTINLTDDTSESSVSAISDNDGSANSVSESAANGTAVGVTALATDADATDDVTYSLDDDAGGRFAIDGTTGVITVADNSLLDFETTTSHTVTVKATSDDGSTSTQTFTINLTDDTSESSVSAISDNDGSANSVSESAANGTAVGVTALATDADATDDVSYSLDDDAGGRFAIDGTTGVITVADNSLLDFETTTSHTVTVKATSDDGSTSTQTFTINLTDDTAESGVSAISDSDGSANSVSESAANGTAVGITALATDPDITDDVAYSLDDDAGGRFAIDGTTGVITVADNSLLDFETTTSHTVTVKATSDDGSTSTQTFTINLTDDTSEASVSAISDNDGSANSVSESAANGTAVGVTALATDADATDDVSYSLDDDAGGRFAIDGTTGVITVADNSLLDFETTTSHTVTVKATSDDGSTSTQTFTINLTDDTSEASVSAISDNDGSANSVSESAANGTAVGVTALATDADATDDVTYSLDDDAGGRFAIDGTTGVITVADNSLLDFETTTSHTVTVKATSDDGSTSTQTFTINLTDDTSESSVSAISDNDGSANSVNESAANGTAVGVTALATDADATDDVSYSLDDDAGGRFAIDGTTGVITVADNSLLDFETTTSHTVTVKATSDDGSTSTQTFTINLTDDTSEASVSAISDNDGSANSVNESAANGTAVGVTALATDADATDDVTYSLDDDAGGRFAIDGTTGVITVADNSLLDFETTTSHTVTVKATSDDGSTSTQTFTINLTDDTSEASVSAISDNDGSANSVNESAANGTAVGVTALATDADATDDVTYSLDDDAGGRFAIDGTTGVITVADNSLLDFETTTSHTVTVKATSDDGSTSTQTFTINLTDDTAESGVSAISDSDGSANSVSESAANGTAVGITALATDPDITDDVTYSLDDDAGGRFAIDGTTGVITVADNSLLDFETTTSHTVTVKATSDDGSTSTQTFTINLTDDTSESSVSAISDNDGSANSVSESAANGTAVGVTALATDADATDDVTYSLDDDAGGRFAIDGTTGVITVADNSLLDFETTTSHTVTVKATSDDGSTSTQTFTINLTDDTSESSVSAISDNDGSANSVNESAANGTAVGVTALATDADATDDVTYSLDDDAGGRFAIDGTTGVITVADNSLLDFETTTSHTVTVKATSDDGSTSTQTFTINLTDDTSESSVSAISDNDGSANSVSESAANGTAVGVTALATDADATDDVSYSLDDDAGGRFAIDGTTGVITVADNSLLDFETTTSHTVTVKATSDDGSTSTQTFTINLTDDTSESSVSAISDNDGSANSVSESAANGTAVGVTALATDADATDDVTYSLDDDAGGRFAIDGTTGVITVADNSLLDFETTTSHTVTVKATSDDGSTSTQTFTINLTDDTSESSVSAISDNDGSANSVNESAANGTAVGVTALATDADATDDVTYSLDDDAGGRFAIDGTTGVITVADNSLLDFETTTSHTVTVKATSDDGSTSTQTFTINLTDDTSESSVSAISDNDGSANSVSESAANGTAVGVTALATDADATDDVSYSLDDDAGGRFAIDGTTGVITVADNSLLDFETTTSHTVTVKATSDDGSTSTQTFTINLTDDTSEASVSAISDNDGSANSVSESAANGTAVGVTALATDADATDDVTYSLDDDAGGRFAIDGTTGVITVADNSLLDFETTTSHTVTVKATSDDGSTSTQTFTINLTDDTSEASVSAISDNDGSANSVNESAANGTAVGVTALATDADATDDVSYSLDDDAGGRFAIDGTTGVITVADNSLLDFETTTSHTVTVKATSDDGSTSTQTFTINLTDDTSEASVSAISDNDGSANSVNESAANGTAVGVTALATDADATDDVTYSLDDDAGGRFAIDGTTGVITVADNSLLDFETTTSHTVTVKATSDDGSTSTQIFTINLTDDTSESSVSAISDNDGSANSVSESAANGTAVGVTALATDADATDDVSYSLDDDAGGRFAIDGTTGVITVADNSLLDFETTTSHTVTVKATSDDGSTSTQTFTINLTDDTSEASVSAISDNDGSANSVNESAANGTAVGVTALATDADATDDVTYSLDDDAGGRFAIDGTTGVITVADNSLLDFETTTSHTVTVKATSDDGSTSTQTFTINLTDDTSESSVSAISDNDGSANSVSESAANGTAVGVTALATDADATDDVTYSLDDDAGGRFAIDGTTGVITVADNSLLDFETTTSHTVTVKATSDDGSTSTQTFTINLTDDTSEASVSAISDNDGSANSVSESAANGTAVGVTALATDADATDDVTYSLDDDAGGRFAIDGTTGVITVADNSLLDFETTTSHTVTVKATSDDGSTSTQTFTINLTDVNDESVSAVTDNDGTANSVAEDAANGTAVGVTALATDADAADTVSYSLDDDAGGRFTIDGSTGVITVADTSLIDFETATSHDVTVKATSTDGSTSTQTFTIDVGDINETPTDISMTLAPEVIETDLSMDFEAGLAGVNDYGDGTQAITTSLNPPFGSQALEVTGGATETWGNFGGAMFDIDTSKIDAGETIRISYWARSVSGTGDITFSHQNGSGDQSNLTHTTSLTEEWQFVTQTVTLDVAKTKLFMWAEDGPNFAWAIDGLHVEEIDPSSQAVNESSTPGTLVATLSTTDPDAGDTETYEIVGGSTNFEVVGSYIFVKDGATLDYETATSHDLTIKVTDSGGETRTETFTVTLTDDTSEFQVGAISDNDGSANSVSESAANGTAVGVTALATDADATDDVTYSLEDDAGGRFTIDGTTGVITVADNSLLDMEAATSHTVTVKATSDDGSTSTQSFTINLTDDTSEFQVGAISDNDGSANSVAESAANGTAVGVTALATDADATDDVSYSLDDDAGGRFAIDGSTGVITVADNSLLDFETATSHTVTVKATSDDGSTSTQTFTINIDDSNETPTDMTLDANQGISLNSDGGNNAYLYTSNGGNILGGLSEMTIEVDFSTSNQSVAYTPLFSYHAGGSSDEIEIGISDTGSGHELYIEIAENATAVSGFDATQLLDGGEHQVSMTWDNTSGSWEIYVDGSSVASGSGLGTGQTIASGGTIVLGQEQDSLGGGFNNTQILDGTLYDVRIFDDVRTAQEISDNAFTEVSSSEPGLIADWQMDDLSGGVTSDATGGENLSVGNVTGSGWNTSTPTLVSTIPEGAADGRLVGTISTTDPDSGDTFTYTLTDDAGGRFAIDTNTGEITVADGSLLDYETATSHNITVQVTDSGGLTHTESLTIDLSNVVEGATDLSVSGASGVTANTPSGTVVGTATALGQESGNTITFALTDDASGMFQIDANTGQISTASAIDSSSVSSHTITVEATDEFGNSYSEDTTFTFGTTGGDTINTGSSNPNVVYAHDGADTITGGSNDDYIVGGGGGDTLDGGAGTDTLSYEGSGMGVTVDLSTGTTGTNGTGDTYSNAVNGHDPVGYWRLHETGDGVTATDETGNNDGTHNYTDPSGAAGPFPNISVPEIANFDGDGDYVEVPHSDSFDLSDGTIQFWFNANDTGTRQGLVSMNDSGSGDSYDAGNFTIYVYNDQIHMYLEEDGTRHDITGGTVSDGGWHHVAFTFGSGGMKLYVDGELAGSDSYTGGIGNSRQNPLVMGAATYGSTAGQANNLNYYLDGELTEGVAPRHRAVGIRTRCRDRFGSQR